MQHRYVVVDAFTTTPLEGNPVAVFFECSDISAARMQRIAKEMNLSEVTFVLPGENGCYARVRIFTPVNELPFAGHPMLGTAVALAATMEEDRIELETAVGIIPFELDRENGKCVAARMRQPVPTWEPFDRDAELLAALGAEESTLPVEVYCNGPRHVYVGFDSIASLSRVRPDQRALADFPDMATNCFAGAGTQWRSRMFSPAYGVAEDAATGSAAGPFAVHLARHGLLGFGEWVDIEQGVEMGRPSVMRARLEGEGDRFDSVEVGGCAITVASGTIHV